MKKVKKMSVKDVIDSRANLQSVFNRVYYYGFKDGFTYDDFNSSEFESQYASWPALKQENFLRTVAGTYWKTMRNNLENKLNKLGV